MKHHLLGILNNLKITHKLILLYVTTFLLPLMLISALFISWLYQTLLNWERMRADTVFQQTETVFNDILTTASELSDRIYVNKPLQDIILRQFSCTGDVYSAYDSISFLDDFLRAYEGIASFRLYTENQTLLDNSYIVKTTSTIRQESWYTTAVVLKGQSFWTYKRDSITGKEYLSLVRSVWRTSDRTFIGVLCVNINPFFVNKTINNQIFDTFIVYKNRIIFATTEPADKTCGEQILSLVERITAKKNATITLNKKKTEAMVNQFHPGRGTAQVFTIIYLIPTYRLTDTTMHITKLVLLILLLFFILSAVLIVSFSLCFGKRVKEVRAGISCVVSKNFEIPESIGGKDEFSEIYSALYDMSVDIKALIKEVYISELEKERLVSRQNDIRFKMLSAQINPHFLFNTLEHIRMRALDSGDSDVPYMLKLLAKILRYNLSVRETSIPLISEIETVNNYLEIQHRRFSSRISYDIMLLCDVRKIQILPLLIQPIVENSFTHGLESKVSGGFIYIEIKEETDTEKPRLEITVRDNGCGISEEKLDELTKKLKEPTVENVDASIGMINVHQRIKLYYGPEYGLEIQSKEGDGTSVHVRLPLIKN